MEPEVEDYHQFDLEDLIDGIEEWSGASGIGILVGPYIGVWINGCLRVEFLISSQSNTAIYENLPHFIPSKYCIVNVLGVPATTKATGDVICTKIIVCILPMYSKNPHPSFSWKYSEVNNIPAIGYWALLKIQD